MPLDRLPRGERLFEVAFHFLLVVDLRVQHRLRHERGPGIVQVQHLAEARRLPPRALDVDPLPVDRQQVGPRKMTD